MNENVNEHERETTALARAESAHAIHLFSAAQPEETTVPRRDECVCKNATNVKYKLSTSEHAFSKCNAVSTNCLASLESKCPRVAVERSLII